MQIISWKSVPLICKFTSLLNGKRHCLHSTCTYIIQNNLLGHIRSLAKVSYLPPSLIVVQIHESPCILLNLPCIHKHFGESYSISDVCRAASPFPSFVFVVLSLLFLVTTTIAQIPLGAGSSDGMGYSSSNDGIGERCFSTTWNKDYMSQKKKKLYLEEEEQNKR